MSWSSSPLLNSATIRVSVSLPFWSLQTVLVAHLQPSLKLPKLIWSLRSHFTTLFTTYTVYKLPPKTFKLLFFFLCLFFSAVVYLWALFVYILYATQAIFVGCSDLREAVYFQENRRQGIHLDPRKYRESQENWPAGVGVFYLSQSVFSSFFLFFSDYGAIHILRNTI